MTTYKVHVSSVAPRVQVMPHAPSTAGCLCCTVRDDLIKALNNLVGLEDTHKRLPFPAFQLHRASQLHASSAVVLECPS